MDDDNIGCAIFAAVLMCIIVVYTKCVTKDTEGIVGFDYAAYKISVEVNYPNHIDTIHFYTRTSDIKILSKKGTNFITDQGWVGGYNFMGKLFSTTAPIRIIGIAPAPKQQIPTPFL